MNLNKGDFIVSDLVKNLMYKRTNVYEQADEKLMTSIFEFAEDYKEFLDSSKTEREACEIGRAHV